MRRSTMRLLHFSLFIGLIITLSGMGPIGCIPAFRGLQPVTQKQLKPKKKSQNAVEILFHKEFRKVRYAQVGGWGMTTFRRVHQRVRFNKRKGFKFATKVLTGGKVTALKVRTVCPDGRVLKMGLNDIQQISKDVSSYSVWQWSKKVTKFTAPGVGVGCVTDFFWEQDIPRDTNALSFAIQSSVPRHKVELTLEYGERKDFRVSLRGMESLWMVLASKKKKKKGKEQKSTPPMLTSSEKKQYVRFKHDKNARRLQVWLNHIPKRSKRWRRMVSKKLLPSHFANTPRLTLELVSTGGVSPKSYLASWKDLDAAYTTGSAWYWDTRTSKQRAFQMDEDWKIKELVQVAKKVIQKAKASGRDAKIKALYYHLRLRMIQTSGGGTYSPRKLYLLYKLRRANRYEINMMYIVMLRAVGIRAYLALLAPNNRIYQDLAPSNPFRAALVYVPPKAEGAWQGFARERAIAGQFLSEKGAGYRGGRKVKGGLILDPSNKFLPLGVVEPSFSDVWAFVIDGAGGRMVLAQNTKGKKNLYKVSLDIQVSKDGTLTGTRTVSTWGSDAAIARNQFARSPKYASQHHRVGWASGVRGICFSEAEVSLAKEPSLGTRSLQEPFVFSHKFTMRNCLVHGRYGLIYKGWYSTAFQPSLRAKVRTHPIHLGASGSLEESIRWSFPKGYRPVVFASQKDVKTSNVTGFVSVSKKGNSVQVVRRLTHTKRTLPPSSYAEVKKVFKLFKVKTALPLVRKVQ